MGQFLISRFLFSNPQGPDPGTFSRRMLDSNCTQITWFWNRAKWGPGMLVAADETNTAR